SRLMAHHGQVTEPTRTRRHPAPPGRVLALLLLVTTSIIGLLAAGLWMIAFAPSAGCAWSARSSPSWPRSRWWPCRSCGGRGGHSVLPGESSFAEGRGGDGRTTSWTSGPWRPGGRAGMNHRRAAVAVLGTLLVAGCGRAGPRGGGGGARLGAG